jgi:serine/threonine protein kinase
VFESSGYLRLTDFGIARKRKEKNANETSGTPGYMSPEVICRLNHSFEADYFALGVIAYEFMLRRVLQR